MIQELCFYIITCEYVIYKFVHKKNVIYKFMLNVILFLD